MSNVKIDKSTNGFPAMVTKTGGSLLVTSTGTGGAPLKSQHNSSTSKKEEEGKTFFVPWGINNDFPDLVLNMVEKSTVGRAGLHYLTKMIYGQENFTYLFKGFDEQNRQLREYLDIEDWDLIQSRTNYDIVRLAQTQDYSILSMGFAEILFDGMKNKVHSISYQKASKVRFAPADKGRIKHAYVSANWAENPKEVDCEKIPVIDPIHFAAQVEEIRLDKQSYKYLLPLRWPDARRDYYSLAFWDSSRNNGYMEISNSIPKFKKALFENQMSLKYHIQVPLEYWEWKFPKWEQLGDDVQNDAIDAFYTELEESLTGAENAQKAIMTFYRSQTQGANKAMGEFKITVIDDKMKNEAYLPDAAAANAEILFSMLINPAETGLGSSSGAYTGGDNNGGSNIRESHIKTRSLMGADRNILNTVFKFVKLYNGYDPKARIATMDEILTTLDTGAGTAKKLD
ncbi:MAG TPA: hypothetical protein VGB63_13050 [Pedobacter sp.]